MTTPLEEFDATLTEAYKQYAKETAPARFALEAAEKTFHAISRLAAKRRGTAIRAAKEAYRKALPQQ